MIVYRLFLSSAGSLPPIPYPQHSVCDNLSMYCCDGYWCCHCPCWKGCTAHMLFWHCNRQANSPISKADNWHFVSFEPMITNTMVDRIIRSPDRAEITRTESTGLCMSTRSLESTGWDREMRHGGNEDPNHSTGALIISIIDAFILMKAQTCWRNYRSNLLCCSATDNRFVPFVVFLFAIGERWLRTNQLSGHFNTKSSQFVMDF